MTLLCILLKELLGYPKRTFKINSEGKKKPILWSFSFIGAITCFKVVMKNLLFLSWQSQCQLVGLISKDHKFTP